MEVISYWLLNDNVFLLIYAIVIDLKQWCYSHKRHSLCFTTGHPNMGGPMRMNPPRGMGGMGPQVGFCYSVIPNKEAQMTVLMKS